jgi:hypothetical protein
MTTLDFSECENFWSREGIQILFWVQFQWNGHAVFDYDQSNDWVIGKGGTNSNWKPAVDFENGARNLINLPKEQHMEAYNVWIRYLFILTTSCSKKRLIIIKHIQ